MCGWDLGECGSQNIKKEEKQGPGGISGTLLPFFTRPMPRRASGGDWPGLLAARALGVAVTDVLKGSMDS